MRLPRGGVGAGIIPLEEKIGHGQTQGLEDVVFGAAGLAVEDAVAFAADGDAEAGHAVIVRGAAAFPLGAAVPVGEWALGVQAHLPEQVDHSLDWRGYFHGVSWAGVLVGRAAAAGVGVDDAAGDVS
jgi:hypothetical protein